jgi:hypothetical protein
MALRSAPIFLALALSLTATADAQHTLAGFRSPSGNIACMFFDYDNTNTLRCDIREAAVTARRPADCDLDFGRAFEMESRGTSQRLCYGDTVMDPRLPHLPYGEVWQHGGFTCTSAQTGVTCFNADRHGFSLSRAKQELF